MAINFPTSLDALTNPGPTDPMTSPSHSTQHANANDAIEQLEAKVGADGSVVQTSHDYKLSGVTSAAKALSTASNLSDLASASTARTNLGLTSLATTTPASGIVTFLTTPSSANLLAAVTDETGTGALVFATSPVLVMPTLGAATGTSLSVSGNLTTTAGNVVLSGTRPVVEVADGGGTRKGRFFAANSLQADFSFNALYSGSVWNLDDTSAGGVDYSINATGHYFSYFSAGSNPRTKNDVVLISSGGLTFPADGTYDIGASGATRPRNLYLFGAATAASIALGGATLGSNALAVTGTTLLGGTLAVSGASTLTGNVGIAVTPLAPLHISPAGLSQYQLTLGANGPNIGSNAYYASGWKYITSAVAALWSADATGSGDPSILVAPSGTAGNAITWVTPFSVIGASAVSNTLVLKAGKVGVANANPSATLDVTGSIAASTTIKPGVYTVAGLPAGTAGDIAYASNGRKAGEGAASGTGVLVFKDGSAWIAVDTGAAVAA